MLSLTLCTYRKAFSAMSLRRRPVGAHPVRDALAVFEVKGFRPPVAAESLFSCVAKRKVTQREGHPAWRFPGIVPGKSVSRGRAFRPDSCPGEKESASCRCPLRGLSTPTHCRTGAPAERRVILTRTRRAPAVRLREQMGIG